MDDVLLVAGIVGCLVLGLRARRRGISGSIFPLVEELHDPRAQHRVEIQVRAEQAGPAPLPGDPPTGRRSAPDGRIELMPSSESPG